jgi:acetyl esterase/lipase
MPRRTCNQRDAERQRSASVPPPAAQNDRPGQLVDMRAAVLDAATVMTSKRTSALALIPAVACIVWMLSSGTVSAQTSSATSVSDSVMRAGAELGSSTLATTYTPTGVTVTVSPTEVRLDPDRQYRAMVCLNAHVLGTAPDGECVSKDIDTRPATSPQPHALPTVTKTMDRPAAGNSGYATEQVIVRYRNGSTWAPFADSWPATNLAGASLPLFAVGATTGPLPEQQGVPLESTSAHGGVNSGQPDSMCVSEPQEATAPRPDLSTTVLGATPFYYEVGSPTGAHAGESPIGVMMLFHGGGWATNGAGAVENLRGDADRWRARGWLTVNSTYRACGQAATDATTAYDSVRAIYGPTVPVCTFGQSAGGHLAMLVAIRRPGGVSCVINQAGPTDAASLLTQGAYDDASGGTQTNLPKTVYNLMLAAFGEENLSGISPLQSVSPGLTGARVLAVTSAHDTLVPYEQMTLLRDRIRAADLTAQVETMQLDAGDQPFTHAPVSQPALSAYYRAERALVAPFAPGP